MWMKENKLTKKHFLMILLGSICVVQVILILVLYLLQDHTAPTITFPTENKVLTQEQTSSVLKGNYDCLLEDVTVEDDTGRDMDGRCIVSSFQMKSDEQYGIVIYKAMDYGGNITSERRIIYLDEDLKD